MRVFSKTANKPISLQMLLLCLIVLISTAVAILTLLFLPGSSPFLIFIPSIALCTWLTGFSVGFFTTIVNTGLIALMSVYPLQKPLFQATSTSYIEMAIFFLVGMFLSYVIDASKKQDKITAYQKKLRQSHALIETLEKDYLAGQKEIQARDQFLAIASHELKTPVTSMLLQVQTAIHNIRNVSLANFSVATLLKMLESTEQQSKRLSKMVNDLLDLSLITTGKIDLEIEETNLSTLVREVAERFLPKLKDERQLSVATEDKVIGEWDKVRIEQAIVNLISNAIKYGDNKPIVIKVRKSQTWAKLEISDQGIGIPLDQQKKIFERFERAVSSREYQGLGVGLYITNQIVKAHQGKITLLSKVKQGTTFTIELPLTPHKAK